MTTVKPRGTPPKAIEKIGNGHVTVTTEARPTQAPPSAADRRGRQVAESQSSPPKMSQEARAALALAQQQLAASTPDTVSAVGEVAAWLNNQTLAWLWAINQNCNSWVGVSGVGWVKLSNSSDSGIVALTVLAAHAKQSGAIVNYRQEADGMIHEMYVW